MWKNKISLTKLGIFIKKIQKNKSGGKWIIIKFIYIYNSILN
jgi:hypothetical protein